MCSRFWNEVRISRSFCRNHLWFEPGKERSRLWQDSRFQQRNHGKMAIHHHNLHSCSYKSWVAVVIKMARLYHISILVFAQQFGWMTPYSMIRRLFDPYVDWWNQLLRHFSNRNSQEALNPKFHQQMSISIKTFGQYLKHPWNYLLFQKRQFWLRSQSEQASPFLFLFHNGSHNLHGVFITYKCLLSTQCPYC